MAQFITQTIGDNAPAAVIINVLGYKYTFGNDVAGLLEAFWDRKRNVPGLTCIVATGVTRKSLYSLFETGKLLQAFQLHFAATIEEALGHLREQLGAELH